MSDAPTKPIISDRYRELQQVLHQNPDYGVASIGFAPIVQQLIANLGAASLSDYGAGKQNLRKTLEAAGVRIRFSPSERQ